MVELYNGDCLQVMQYLIDKGVRVNLTVTSPPYDDMRSYGNDIDKSWGEHVWKPIIKKLYELTETGGAVVWVVGDSTKNGNESGTSFKQALWFKECGFNLHDTMIYQKSQACFGSNRAYLQAFEYMFVFSKGKLSTFNPIRDRVNVVSGKQSVTKRSAFNKEGIKSDRHEIESSELGKRKNIWEYGVGANRTGHPAVFPEKLAEDHILSWSNEDDIVFDPFMGSGTTGKMAILNLRKFIGIELSEEYFEIAKNRIDNETLY